MFQKIQSDIRKFTIQDWIFVVFAILWIVIIIVDYLNKQIVYGPAFKYFRYFRLFGFLILVGIGLSAYYNQWRFFKRIPKVRINGLVLLALIIGIIWAITISFNHYWNAPLDYTNYLHLAGMAIFTLGSSLLLVTSTYSIGSFMRKLLIPNIDRSLTFILVDISFGFVIYTFLMMLLGAFGLLNQPLLLGFIFLMCLINYQDSFWFLKRTLWDKIDRPSDFSFWGGVVAFFTLVYLTMNYLYSQAPFPLGFDARNYYVNISKLIADSESLVAGFQPYAWSLVMSTGYIAFDSPEITMFISTLGGILAMFAIYEMSKRYLKVTSNLSWFVVLLVLVSPTITNHWIIEFKTDLALLFIQLVVLNLVMWWLFEVKKSKKAFIPLMESNDDLKIVVIIGMLLGYCLSIKVLSVFLVYALFLAMWYHSKDLIGMLGIALLGIGLILIIKLDDISGLRDYHLSPTQTGIVCAIIGIIALLYSAVKHSERFINSMKTLLLCGAVMSITFSPWIYKNYTFTKSTSMMKLLIGEKPKPDIDIRKILQNHKESNN